MPSAYRKDRGARRHHELYNTWKHMRRRCNIPTNQDYPRYGGRGIKVCGRWSDFWVFVDDMESAHGKKPSGWTIDRIDGDGDYCPENCEWATTRHQASHRGGRNANSSGYLGVDWHNDSWRARYRKGEAGTGRGFAGSYKCVHEAGRAVALMEGREFVYNPEAGRES